MTRWMTTNDQQGMGKASKAIRDNIPIGLPTFRVQPIHQPVHIVLTQLLIWRGPLARQDLSGRRRQSEPSH